MIVVVCGLPGAGKSTLAAPLADRLGAALLGSDRLRGVLGLRGDYRPEATARVYRELTARAREALARGPVVLDATFGQRAQRAAVAALAREAGVPLRLVRLVVDEATAVARLARPRADSGAGPAAHAKMRSREEPFDEPHLALDAALPPEALVEAALAYVRREAAR